MQEYAARELVARNWRYHKGIQVWLTKDSNVEPVLINPDVEKGVYIFFDPHNWEKIKKEFVLHYSSSSSLIFCVCNFIYFDFSINLSVNIQYACRAMRVK